MVQVCGSYRVRSSRQVLLSARPGSASAWFRVMAAEDRVLRIVDRQQLLDWQAVLPLLARVRAAKSAAWPSSSAVKWWRLHVGLAVCLTERQAETVGRSLQVPGGAALAWINSGTRRRPVQGCPKKRASSI